MTTKVATNLADILKLQAKRAELAEKRTKHDTLALESPIVGATKTKEQLATLDERIDDPRKCQMTSKEKMLAGKKLTHKQKLVVLRDGIMESFLGNSDDPEESKGKLVGYVEMLKVKHPSVAIKLLDKVMPKDDGISRVITIQAPMIVIDASNADNVAAAMEYDENKVLDHKPEEIDYSSQLSSESAIVPIVHAEVVL